MSKYYSTRATARNYHQSRYTKTATTCDHARATVRHVSAGGAASYLCRCRWLAARDAEACAATLDKVRAQLDALFVRRPPVYGPGGAYTLAPPMARIGVEGRAEA